MIVNHPDPPPPKARWQRIGAALAIESHCPCCRQRLYGDRPVLCSTCQSCTPFASHCGSDGLAGRRARFGSSNYPFGPNGARERLWSQQYHTWAGPGINGLWTFARGAQQADVGWLEGVYSERYKERIVLIQIVMLDNGEVIILSGVSPPFKIHQIPSRLEHMAARGWRAEWVQPGVVPPTTWTPGKLGRLGLAGEPDPVTSYLVFDLVAAMGLLTNDWNCYLPSPEEGLSSLGSFPHPLRFYAGGSRLVELPQVPIVRPDALYRQAEGLAHNVHLLPTLKTDGDWATDPGLIDEVRFLREWAAQVDLTRELTRGVLTQAEGLAPRPTRQARINQQVDQQLMTRAEHLVDQTRQELGAKLAVIGGC